MERRSDMSQEYSSFRARLSEPHLTIYDRLFGLLGVAGIIVLVLRALFG
jgi:hypothetical protein